MDNSTVLETIALGLGVIGVAVIPWGVAVTTMATFRLEASMVEGPTNPWFTDGIATGTESVAAAWS